jgi:orotate phosphoribosyltransferase-like protein
VAKAKVTKRDLILKAAKRRKRGVEVTVIAEEVNCSRSYVRLVLRDAGFAPLQKRSQSEPIWSAAK